jgi:D-3-phosphoglycerate dehydrogenase
MDYHILDWEMGSLEELNRRNLNVEKNGPSAEPPPEELWSLIGNADILIVHFCPVSKELMDAALRLKIIGTMRTGLSNIDTISVKERGINMVNLPGRLADSVAEYTVGMIIAETRNIARSHEALRSGRWVKNYYSTPFCFELAGKTIGIIGFGEIGKRVAAKLASFDVKILVYDPLFTEEDAHRGDIVKAELQKRPTSSIRPGQQSSIGKRCSMHYPPKRSQVLHLMFSGTNQLIRMIHCSTSKT